MEVDLIQFLIICPLVGLAGFIDAIAGGGGLVSLPAYIIAGLPAHNAIATNKLSSTMGTALTTARFAWLGYIPWRAALPCIPAALIGSALGANLALVASDLFLKVAMIIVLPCIAAYLLFGKGFTEEREPLSAARTCAIGIAAAFVIGIYDGFYGPGTGTFLILALQALAHMPIKRANGTTKLINLSTNVSALVVFLAGGYAYIALGIAAGVFNMIGNYIGSRCFDKAGAGIAKPIMIVVLAIFFVRVVLELAGVL